MRRAFRHGGERFDHHQPGLRQELGQKTAIPHGIETDKLIVKIGKMSPHQRNRIRLVTGDDRTDNMAPPRCTPQCKSGKTIGLEQTVTRIFPEKALQDAPARNTESRPIQIRHGGQMILGQRLDSLFSSKHRHLGRAARLAAQEMYFFRISGKTQPCEKPSRGFRGVQPQGGFKVARNELAHQPWCNALPLQTGETMTMPTVAKASS